MAGKLGLYEDIEERKYLARELHDSVSQILYSIGLGIQDAREILETEPRQAVAALDYVTTLVEAGLTEVRSLLCELHPEFLENMGLAVALQKQVEVLRLRYKMSVEVVLDGEPALTVECKYALYRIAQEALHNVVRHARANKVILRLSFSRSEMVLEVCDDGRGFDPESTFPGHWGLHSMQERAAQLNGALKIVSAPGRGTSIRVCVPTLFYS